MKATLGTGFRKDEKDLMKHSARRSLLCALLVAAGLAGCGDPTIGAKINDGSDGNLLDADVATCTLTGGEAGVVVGISAFKDDVNTTNVVFGADTILDIQPLPADTQPIPNAQVFVYGNADVTIFALGSTTGTLVYDSLAMVSSSFSTGDDGTVVALVTNPASTQAAASTVDYTVSFFPMVGGEGYGTGVSVTCP